MVRIPGAGAGFVRDALEGQSYEIGKRYSLTAVADNDYIFSRWSAPGITGAQAENRQLSFVFTEELAQSPVITATFVKNPFREDVTGEFNGLVLAAEGVNPDVTNTGAARLKVSKTGSFTGELRYDGRRVPLLGSFDTGRTCTLRDAAHALIDGACCRWRSGTLDWTPTRSQCR